MFRFATNEDYEQIYQLFHTCFGDSMSEIRYFMDCFREEKEFCIGLCEKDQNIISMACLIPGFYQNKPAYYVYGVCTHPNFRNQGISVDLMNYLKESAKKKNIACLFLVPASDSLMTFYQKQGFLCYFPTCPHITDTSFVYPSHKEFSYSCQEITETEYLYLRKNFEQAPNVFSLTATGNKLALEQRNDTVHLLKITSSKLSEPLGCIVYKKEKEITLLEITSWNKEEQALAFNFLFDYFSRNNFCENFYFQPGNRLCIYPLSDMELTKNPYFAFPMDTIL